MEELFAVWKEYTDQTYDLFGCDCTVFFPEKMVEVPTVAGNNNPKVSSIRTRKSKKTVTSNEKTLVPQVTTDTVRLKLYWTPKEWQKIFGLTALPEGSVIAKCKMADAEKINNATRIEYNDGVHIHRFSRTGEVVPDGFQKKHYGYCILSVES